MNRTIPFAIGEYYHIYNRGNDKKHIFIDNADYKRFMRLLFFCNSSKPVNVKALCRRMDKGALFADLIEANGNMIVDIGAYCLMPNHFHLLLHERQRGGISLFLQRLCTSYSMFFNCKYERTGKLFEGVFKSQHADSDEYLKYLFAYIHLNPLKILDKDWKTSPRTDTSSYVDHIEHYPYSSYQEYINPTGNALILNKLAFPGYFLDQDIKLYTQDWFQIDHPR